MLILGKLQLKDSHPVLANLLVIQASAPAATAIILQVRAYGGDVRKTGNMMFLSYLICLIALPLWLAVWATI